MSYNSTFLSIDLDYFDDSPRETIARFLRRVDLLDVEKVVYRDHHDILPMVNKLDWETLINVDHHSDLADYVEDENGELIASQWVDHKGDKEFAELDCGNWVNYVKKIGSRLYSWRYSMDMCLAWSGRCDDRTKDRSFLTPAGAKYRNWKNIEVKQGLRGIPWDDIVGVAIVVSPEYSDTSTLANSWVLLQEMDVTYRSGKRDLKEAYAYEARISS